ncbi:helix-turn-helix domain-containing protein [Paenibacillus sepulcri]|uniref:AraC family transcriptional regulator n=1 Tax=Paenibacillus sepulcri TaxID=359917 RepID=A0ABS7BZM5_9BACL|nr:AraC family transcriptional regulator [Paenibacillus sepulcri]
MNRFIPKQAYIRIFLSLCILFTVVSVPFVYMMTHQFSIYAMKQIDQVNETEIAHSRDNAEFIFNKMIAYGFNMYADKSISTWLMASEESQGTQVDAIVAANKYMTTEPFLDNVYLINMRTEHTIDLKYGLSSFQQFRDQPMLEMAKQKRSSYQRFFVHQVNGTTKLAMIIPTVPSGQQSFGYLVLLLNDALMKQYLLKGDANSEIQSFILDNEGNLMLGASDSTQLNMELAATAVKGSGSYTKDHKGESWSVQYALIEPQGWYIYHMAKLEGIRADFISFRLKMIIFVSCLVVVLIAILFWNSRRTYKPFSQLADQLEMKFGLHLKNNQKDDSSMAEYKVIRYGIEMLEDRMGQLDSSMREHRNVIKTEYLRQWILQGKLITPVEHYLREQSSLFEHEELYVSVIRINEFSRFKEQYNFASRKLMKYAIGNIAEEVINRSWYAESVDLGGDHLALLISGNHVPMNELTGVLEEAREQIRQWTQIHITAAVSGQKSLSDDVRSIYQHIHELTMLNFISGAEKIFIERDFEDYMQRVQPLADDNLLDELIKKVRMGRPEEIAASLDLIFAHMQTMHYTQSKFQLSLMLYTLFKTFNKLPSVESVEGIENILESFDKLSGVRGWLEQELLGIIDDMSSKKGASRRDEVVTEIVEYVKNHLHDPMLTIEEISGHLSLSTRHVRQLFKEVFDKTLSDYILQERIVKVKELLVSTDWTVTDIGERSGFQTKSHFFTVFKKATGMTPSQYREKQ